MRPAAALRPRAARRSRVAPCRASQQPAERFPAQVCVVLGTQWGDEGKGKLVDILAQQYDVVARAQVGDGGSKWGRNSSGGGRPFWLCQERSVAGGAAWQPHGLHVPHAERRMRGRRAFIPSVAAPAVAGARGAASPAVARSSQ